MAADWRAPVEASTVGVSLVLEMPVRIRDIADREYAYVFGPRTAEPGACVEVARLSSNETAFGPLPGVLNAAAVADAVTRYPDAQASALRARIAREVGVGDECLAVGSGSVGLVDQIVRLTVGPDDEVLVGVPTFPAYATLTAALGGRVVGVPLDGTRLDLSAMANSVTDRTRVVFICSPNNPTGGSVSHRATAAFLEQAPDDLLIVIDEAYHEFVADPDAVDGRALQAEHDNVLVLRTFSKAYGLAGMRVGYCVGHPSLIAALQSLQTPFAVNAPAQLAAIASLDSPDQLAERVAFVASERSRVEARLRELGFPVEESDGNFVWLPVGVRTPSLAASLARSHVLVRPIGDWGIRVTIGAREENDLFLAAIEEAAL